MPKDYKVTVKVQNNYLIQAMNSAGLNSAADLARLAGISSGEVGHYLNLRRTPVMRNGEYYPGIVKISKALNIIIAELFPPGHLLEALDKNSATVEMNKVELLAITGRAEPFAVLESEARKDALSTVMGVLSTREREVLEMRFGIGQEEKTLEWIGAHFGVSSERIRAIEARALRKMRHPVRIAALDLENHSQDAFFEALNDRKPSAWDKK